MTAIDFMMSGAAVGLLLLVAGLSLRDNGRSAAARWGAWLAAGAAAYLVETAPGFREAAGLWSLPLFVLMAGNSVVLWLAAWAFFDDGFRPRLWQAAIWLAVASVASFNAFVFGAMRPAFAGGIARGLDSLDLVFAALAVAQALASWPGDLVEGRRRVRLVVVIGGAIYIAAHATLRESGLGGGLTDSAGLLSIAATVAVMRLGVRAPLAAPSHRANAELTSEDVALLARLDRLMVGERLYREPRLSIADVARRMALPEYRLRRLINQGRGERNFAAFVNRFRLAEVKAALADPAQAGVPILTMALDAGFGSLAPFNRAFRADTGVTPTDYRLGNLRDLKTADRISNSR